MRWNRTALRLTSTLTACVTFLASGTMVATRVRAQDHTDVVPAAAEHNLADEAHTDHVAVPREEIQPDAVREIRDARTPEPVREPPPEPGGGVAVPLTLPTGPGKSAVTPQAISLPNAEGSIQGMGESFSPVLSSGTATFNVPIALPPGRAGVQPSLALGYSSSSGNGDVGIGWSIAVPYIARQDDRGLPLYIDATSWHPQEDRFFYNGGQELVPVSNADATAIDGQDVPAELLGWQQYRARVEGAFMRFFRHYDPATRRIDRWVVQSKDGTRFDFGVVPAGELPTDFGDSHDALLSENDDGSGRVYKWQLTRMSDAHGSTVYYRYTRDQKQLYIADIHYVSPAACGTGHEGDARAIRTCTAALADFGRRVRFAYEPRTDMQSSYVATWRVATAQRLHRIDITAYHHVPAARTLVRRYRLGYDPTSFYSLLTSVQVEGRPDSGGVGDVTVSEGSLDDHVVGLLLPAMTFEYSGSTAGVSVPFFGALSTTIHTSPGSPNHSVDEVRTDLFDVNSDGLPDVITTDPAAYRTADGRPAVGVFFNGFHGLAATPSSAGDFSDAVPVPVPAGFDGVMTLSNLNVNPLDIDGDGRSDLLHMPRVRDYDYFTPMRESATADVVSAVSPAAQSWVWMRVPVSLPSTDVDPRIDFGRDASHLKVLDVNGDSLIDVVRTTGTEMQTWLNLGWIPDRDASGRSLGDGRFGSATWDGRAWALSTAPYESCLMHEGIALDFEDPNVQLADLNGDGLQDIVHMERGRLYYWPGRGIGLWGDGSSVCAPADPGAGRAIEVASPPLFDIGADGVLLQDVNADGADDAVQVRYHAIDVWLNQGGASFTSRFTIDSADLPYAPSYQNRIRFSDMDGSGTPDIIWANAGRYQWLDFMDGVKPRMLVAVHNGLGAETDLTYGSSASEYLRDLAACTSGSCHSWSGARLGCDVSGAVAGACDLRDAKTSGYASGGSTVVSTVVTSMTTTDHFENVGREANVMTTRFAYHDGYYEGIEQEFRGFGSAEATAVGDAYAPTSITRTTFLQGRRPNGIATNRIADNPDEALKGRESLTEVFDERGSYLSTTHAGFVVRRLLTGLNGYTVSYAFVEQSDELRYSALSGPGVDAPLSLRGIRRELADTTADTTYPDVTDSVSVRMSGWAHVRTTIDAVDDVGNVLRETAHGRVRGEYGEPLDNEAITTVMTPTLAPGSESHWLWRTASTHIEGGDGEGGVGAFATPDPVSAYSAVGDLLDQRQAVNLPASGGYTFGGDLAGSSAYAQTNEHVETSTIHDAWGNALESCAGGDLRGGDSSVCLRHSTITYDATFDQFPATERVFTSTTAHLDTGATWDEGLAMLTTARDPNLQDTTVAYDGLGRLTSVTPPEIDASCTAPAPTTTIEYHLSTAADFDPVSFVHATTHLSCSGPARVLEAYSYVDGLGRARASTATGARDDDSEWIQSGVTLLTARGTPRRTFHPAVIGGNNPRSALTISAVPHTDAMYDAFGRVIAGFAEDGALTTTDYQALTTDVCDPLDNGSDPTFAGTCTTTRSDGLGRVIDQVQRNRQPDDPSHATERQRLWSYYRADGALVWLVRAKTVETVGRPVDPTAAALVADAHVRRHFIYDTAGRRLGATDPDTDSRTNPDSHSNTWRYLFNRVGDLAAVRDPRGCGQNFFYDRAGRLVGEDYVLCAEAQRPTGVTGDYTGDDVVALEPGAPEPVDVLYTFDDYAPCGAFTLPSSVPVLPKGHATCVSDRGQRSIAAYDARGNAVYTARQMAVIDPGIAMPLEATTLSGDPPDVFTSDAEPQETRVYDTAHTYERTAAFDHANRPVSMTLPKDPDYPVDGGVAPLVGGELAYNHRGLPAAARVTIDSTPYPIVTDTTYSAEGLVTDVTYGDHQDGGIPTAAHTEYDGRLRPTRMYTVRDVVGTPDPGTLAAVTVPFDQTLAWDPASNITAITDNRDPREWSPGHEPQSVAIRHDALYHVVDAEYAYGGPRAPEDDPTDWRADMNSTRSVDPMRTTPAPMVPALPSSRVMSLTWSYDWLGNMTGWEDDAPSFYERSLGPEIRNGYGNESGHDRASALYFASTLPMSAPPYSGGGEDRGGYLEVQYGEGGDVIGMTVHAQCGDEGSAATCWAPGGSTSSTERAAAAHAGCRCGGEQHYQYRWDEVNRLVEARRYERSGGTGTWTLRVAQRLLYDSTNERCTKMIYAADAGGTDPPEKVVLYVFPSDFERRGLVRDISTHTRYETYAAAGLTTDARSETSYLVAQARVVWQTRTPLDALDPDARLTLPVTDLLGTTSATIDIRSGALTEASTYLPSGARETYSAADAPPEARGFSGKEADEEVGLVYFGERYLIPRLGRWATPDPESIHGARGGDTLNSFHYIRGNLLEGRDPIGLEDICQADPNGNEIVESQPEPSPPVPPPPPAECSPPPPRPPPRPPHTVPPITRSAGPTVHVRIDLPGDGERFADHAETHGATSTDTGHVFIVIDSPERGTLSVGFYPHPPSGGMTLSDTERGVPGELHDDAHHGYEYEASFAVSEGNVDQILKYAEDHGTGAENWSHAYTCTDFAIDALQAGGVNLPALPTREAMGVQGHFPGSLARELRAHHEGRYLGYHHSGPTVGEGSSDRGGSSGPGASSGPDSSSSGAVGGSSATPGPAPVIVTQSDLRQWSEGPQPSQAADPQ